MGWLKISSLPSSQSCVEGDPHQLGLPQQLCFPPQGHSYKYPFPHGLHPEKNPPGLPQNCPPSPGTQGSSSASTLLTHIVVKKGGISE